MKSVALHHAGVTIHRTERTNRVQRTKKRPFLSSKPWGIFGTGFAFGAIVYWMILSFKVPSLPDLPSHPAIPNQAVYQWKGYYRVAADPRPVFNRL